LLSRARISYNLTKHRPFSLTCDDLDHMDSSFEKPPNVVCDGDVCRIVDQDSDVRTEVVSKAVPSSLQGPILSSIESLVDSDTWQPIDPLRALSSKRFVLLYFSASWCPPCRAFTQILSPWVREHANDVAVVFVSQDRSESDMRAYVSHKGFLCIPYNDSARQQLPQMMQVSMLPTLVVVNAQTGAYVTDWGRSAITKNPDGCIEDWTHGYAGVSWLQLFKFW